METHLYDSATTFRFVQRGELKIDQVPYGAPVCPHLSGITSADCAGVE